MKKVILEYNPLICTTEIIIDGTSVVPTSQLYKYRNTPIEKWIDRFMGILSDDYNDDEYEVHICSTEAYTAQINKALHISAERLGLSLESCITIEEQDIESIQKSINRIEKDLQKLHLECPTESQTYDAFLITAGSVEECDPDVNAYIIGTRTIGLNPVIIRNFLSDEGSVLKLSDSIKKSVPLYLAIIQKDKQYGGKVVEGLINKDILGGKTRKRTTPIQFVSPDAMAVKDYLKSRYSIKADVVENMEDCLRSIEKFHDDVLRPLNVLQKCKRIKNYVENIIKEKENEPVDAPVNSSKLNQLKQKKADLSAKKKNAHFDRQEKTNPINQLSCLELCQRLFFLKNREGIKNIDETLKEVIRKYNGKFIKMQEKTLKPDLKTVFNIDEAIETKNKKKEELKQECLSVIINAVKDCLIDGGKYIFCHFWKEEGVAEELKTYKNQVIEETVEQLLSDSLSKKLTNLWDSCDIMPLPGSTEFLRYDTTQQDAFRNAVKCRDFEPLVKMLTDPSFGENIGMEYRKKAQSEIEECKAEIDKETQRLKVKTEKQQYQKRYKDKAEKLHPILDELEKLCRIGGL